MSRAPSVLLLFGSLLLSGGVEAQKSAQPLTNKDVVEMVQGGLPEATIINAIKAQDTNFDVSASALIQLKRQGVSSNIMNAMLATARNRSQSTTPPATAQEQSSPAPASASPARLSSNGIPAKSAMTDVLGTWQGVYFAYPEVMRVEITLRPPSSPAANTIEGELRFEPLTSAPRTPFASVKGSYRVRGQYDLASAAITLDPSEWIERPNQPVIPLKMTGVFERRSGTLAGTFGNNSPATVLYFVLARPNQVAGMLFDPLKHVPDTARPGGGASLGERILQTYGRNPFGGPVGSHARETDELHKMGGWVSKLTSEYPKLDLRNTPTGYPPAQNLFEDSYFERYFGKTFDRMSNSDRQKMTEALRSYLGDRPSEDTDMRRRLAFLGTFFQPNYVPGTIVAVLAQRTLRSWRDETQHRLSSLAPEASAFAQIDAIDSAAKKNLAILWPSEGSAVEKEIAAARAGLAGPVLSASAQEAIQSAQGYNGAVALASWESQQRDTLKWASDAVKGDILGRVRTRLDDLMTKLMDEELKRAESFGQGSAAVAKGRAWQADFKTRFSFAMGSPPVVAALVQVQKRRAKDLADAQAVIAREIDSQNSVEGLDRVVSSYFVVPEDGRTEVGSSLMKRAQQRRGTLEEERAVADARQRRAAVLGKRESGVSSLLKRKGPPSGDVEPTEEEMYDALQAKVDAYNEGMKRTLDTCDAGGFQNDPLLALQCLTLHVAGGGRRPNMHIEIAKFRKVGKCTQIEQTAYLCNYIVAQSSHLALPPSMRAILESAGVAQARFLPFENGWLLVTDQ